MAEWYQTIFQLELVEEDIHPQDTGRLFKLPKREAMLWVGQHSEIKGKNLDLHRIMVDFEVISVQKAYHYLLNKKLNFAIVDQQQQAVKNVSPTAITFIYTLARQKL